MSTPELPPPIDALDRPRRLYSLRSIDVATFLGSCLAGTLIVALNLRAVGRGAAAFVSLIVGFLGLAVLIGAFSLIEVPESREAFVGFVAQGIQVAVVHLLATRLLGDSFDRHEQAGGLFYSTWRAAGVALAVIALPLFAVLYLTVGAALHNLENLENVQTDIFAPERVSLSEDFYLTFQLTNFDTDPHTLDSIRVPVVLLESPPRRQSDPQHNGVSTNAESSTGTFTFHIEIPAEGNLTVRLPARASRTGTLWPPVSVCLDEPDICANYQLNLPVVP